MSVGDCLLAIATSRLNEQMSHVASRRGGFRNVAVLVVYIIAVAVVVAAIAIVVESAPSSRAPVDAVFRIEGLGCKRNPTRTVGTVVSESLPGGGQLVLTVAHGVVGQEATEIVDGSTRVRLRLIAVDSDWDLAVLHAEQPLQGDDDTPVGGVAFAEGRIGNASFVVFEDRSGVREAAVVRPAYLAKRLRIRTEDIYLNDVESREGRPGLEVRTPARVGDSGGPLFDANGEMVGLVWGTSRKSSDRSWATRVQAATSMIETAKVALRRGDAPSGSLRLLACAP